jgi:hypothetical protein
MPLRTKLQILGFVWSGKWWEIHFHAAGYSIDSDFAGEFA